MKHVKGYPHVTRIIEAVMPVYHNGTEWHMQRGQAAHACYAMLAQGKPFEFDPQLQGYVDGWRKWYADVKPVFHGVEIHGVHPTYAFQGTTDGIVSIAGVDCIIDYKASHDPRTELQLGFYALLLHKLKLPIGWEVVIDDKGAYKMHGPYDLTQAGNEALAVLTVYNVMQRLRLQNDQVDAPTTRMSAKKGLHNENRTRHCRWNL